MATAEGTAEREVIEEARLLLEAPKREFVELERTPDGKSLGVWVKGLLPVELAKIYREVTVPEVRNEKGEIVREARVDELEAAYRVLQAGLEQPSLSLDSLKRLKPEYFVKLLNKVLALSGMATRTEEEKSTTYFRTG